MLWASFIKVNNTVKTYSLISEYNFGLSAERLIQNAFKILTLLPVAFHNISSTRKHNWDLQEGSKSQ